MRCEEALRWRRICLKEYTGSLTHAHTNALVCLLCARLFVQVHGGQTIISLGPLFTEYPNFNYTGDVYAVFEIEYGEHKGVIWIMQIL